MQKLLDAGDEPPKYDAYVTLGLNIGTTKSCVPTLGKNWVHAMCPVLVDREYQTDSANSGNYSTVMRWKANKELNYDGKVYGMKDMEFAKFIALPRLIKEPMEVAASGPGVPRDILKENGWIVKDGDDVSCDVDQYRRYIANSKGEISVVKNAFVETNCGVFMERSGHYMLSKHPIVLQDNGWSEYLPSGRGLFAVKNVEEAAEAISIIKKDYKQHGEWAYDIAREHLDATKLLKTMIGVIGI